MIKKIIMRNKLDKNRRGFKSITRMINKNQRLKEKLSWHLLSTDHKQLAIQQIESELFINYDDNSLNIEESNNGC